MTRFDLPILKSTTKNASPDELFRLALHAEEIYEGVKGTKVSLDFGLAIHSREFSRLNSANQVRDVAMLAEMPPERMIAEVDGIFGAEGLTCRQWIFNDGHVPGVMKELLSARGFSEKTGQLFALRAAGDFSRARKDLTVIPGRASFAKLRELTESAERLWGTTSEESIAQYREEAVRSLDDPQVDNLLALDGEAAAGTAYLVTAGECGLITDLYVHPERARKHVATTLMERVIELAGRSRLRHLMLFCDDDNAAARGLYERSGFVAVRGAEIMEKAPPDSE